MEKFTVIWRNIGWTIPTITVLSDENIEDPEANPVIAEFDLFSGTSHEEYSSGHGFFWKSSKGSGKYNHLPFEEGRTEEITISGGG